MCHDGVTGEPKRAKASLAAEREPTDTCKGKELLREPNSKRSALRRHCDFWDADHDGLVYPWDIYTGFRKLGFHIALCLWAAVSMALCSSYVTQSGWIPHPLFAIRLDNIVRSRHGSTTATYDMDAEIDMRRFDAIFTKYGEGKDHLTLRTLYNVWAGQCCANDWFGWFAGGLEWIALYILLWPEDGRLQRNDILGVFDGSIFEKIAIQRSQQSN
ncbi:Caleosin related protein-domain-containing protein [Paraphoma chrysanthemicola]|nr:Caleosin related protein-domain-containing protein [Paraphoma chrysanthemicola]